MGLGAGNCLKKFCKILGDLLWGNFNPPRVHRESAMGLNSRVS
jgi:hypothetical protein